MRRSFLIISIFFYFIIPVKTINAQSFAPLGTKWYYGHRENPFGSAAEGYLFFEVTGDTIIDTTSCRIITKTYFSSDSSINNAGELYLYKNANRIYYYNNGKFELIYDFNLVSGDTMKIKEPYYSGSNPDTIIKFYVDSVSSDSISGIPHKIIYFHDVNNRWDMFNPIIEDIGSLQYFFPRCGYYDCDVANCYSLRCYEDSITNYHIAEPCNEIVSSVLTKESKIYDIKIFPNPTNSKLIISISDNSTQIESVNVFNTIGKLVLAKQYDTNYTKTMYSCHCHDEVKLNIKNLINGVYYVKINTNNGEIIRKFVKQ